ncbi:putative regulator of nonsense transcripts 1, putative,nonsense mRNA reducing factor 1 [Trypanosoma grayi]|uniref:putative regulator of nonsense transcripts 1, putative,nonsense mRNA reducing factor 1 n=1 Tax=Trypanosoma grayi TaxID=71804 RepID=UPI0004F45805|nr:putative regulator of nonsense transcripts 1, putative,nonsense mRNA reducing factor 1 [Trypanosoma grayi]KEG09267.1 putative regulator of nonsense transcripts 1, putative,nonsense mRNA reducing factor 1 [Trypanosoma grayi]
MESYVFEEHSSTNDHHTEVEGKNELSNKAVTIMSEAPQASCSYCGEDDPRCLAMCSACSRWFCNGAHGTSGSHIILHLVKFKHRVVQLHAENELGDSTLECYVCRSPNIFSLGFMPSKEDSVVVLVCREPCLHSKTLRDLNWDSSTWLPLIEERRLLPWICKVPNVPCKTLTLHDITTLELSWESQDKQSLSVTEKAPQVPLRFENGEEYLNVFSTLITMDAQASKVRKDSAFEDIPCKLQKQVGRRYFFLLKQLPLADVGVHRGDYASISIKGGSRSLNGVLVEIGKPQLGEDEVVFEADDTRLAQEKKALNEILAASTVVFRLEFSSVANVRKCKALEEMVRGQAPLSAYLYYTILGQTEEAKKRFSLVDMELSAKRLPDLNFSQESAVRTALKNPLTLIQGPPGTGKTSTSVAIVYQMHQKIKSQILVCAPSNVAVDHLSERIPATGLNVVRVQAHYREAVPNSVEHIGLDKQVEDYIEASRGNQQMKRLLSLLKAGDNLSDEEYNLYQQSVSDIERLILDSADVICCTCIAAGDRRMRHMRFKHVLIDEATQGNEPETLIPLVRGAKQVFLVGDHCQLRPVVVSLPAEKAGLRRSLFERLLTIGHRAVRLEVQYRMHPCLSLFPSSYFYEGTLQNGVTEEQRDASKVFPWPDPTQPLFFYNTTGAEELGANGSSYLNRAEAALTEQIVTRLIRDGGVNPNGIGVITPYSSQCRYVKNYFTRCGPLSGDIYEDVEVSSVDAFQGREKEFIILSCVRSNHRQGIGFVMDWRRLNVSITRARRGMIILGNVQVLSRYAPWHALLEHLMGLSLIVDGPIGELVTSKVVLQKPRTRNVSSNPEEALN